MTNDTRSEHICSRLRDLLNSDSVKLWLKPYFNDEKTNDAEIEQLAQKYSSTLKLPVTDVKDGLLILQCHSITRLREQEQYRASGLSTLRVRISGCNLSNEASCSKNSVNSWTGCNQLAVGIRLSDPGRVLQIKVSDESGIPAYRLKLIAQGRIIDIDASLESQGIKNSSQIMAVVLTENPDEVNVATSHHILLEDTRADVMTLVNAQKTSYFELQDQKGNALNLPAAERKALLLAMALHERGRSVLNRGDHAMALILFLEADKEFKKCASELLKAVDNAALLNLDIAWCYLCLRSVSYLPDAQKRLQDCQEMLVRSYGPNMERVIALKGSAGNEAVLMMRLHLLQAIVMFHQNKIPEFRQLLLQAETELKGLKVKDEDMSELISLGYKASEARLGLRAAHGDLSTAEVFIREWRREKEEAREKNVQRQKLERSRRLLGLCADGKTYVEPSFVQMIENMGFPREQAICALAHTNNLVSRAIETIQEHPELLKPPQGQKRYRTDPAALDQVLAMGFNRKIARRALKKHLGDVQKALDDLVTDQISAVESLEVLDEDSNTSSVSSGSLSNHEEECQNQREAFERLAPDMKHSDDDHLDQSLIDEERFLIQYKSLLESIDEK